MSTSMQTERHSARDYRWAFVHAALWGLFVFVVLFSTYDIQEFHVDELKTKEVTEMSWIKVADNRIRTTHSPLYFWLVKPLSYFDIDPLALRIPSIVFAALALGILTASLHILAGLRTAAIFAATMAVCPAFIYMAHYARPYPLLLLMHSISIASLMFVTTAAKPFQDAGASKVDPRTEDFAWKALTLSTCLAAATMMAGVLYGFVLVLFGYLVPALRKDQAFAARWRRFQKPVLITCVVVAAVLAPSIKKRAMNYWADDRYPLSFESVFNAFSQIFVSPTGFAHPDTWLWAGLPLIAVIVMLLVRLAFAANMRTGALALACLPNAVGLLLVFVALSAFSSLLVPRYFHAAVPGLCVLVALAASDASRHMWARPILVVALGLAVLQGYKGLMDPSRNQNWLSAARYISASQQPPTTILMKPGWLQDNLRFLLTHRVALDPLPEIKGMPSDNEGFMRRLGEEMSRAAEQGRDVRVWVGFNNPARTFPPQLNGSERFRACLLKPGAATLVSVHPADPAHRPETCDPVLPAQR